MSLLLCSDERGRWSRRLCLMLTVLFVFVKRKCGQDVTKIEHRSFTRLNISFDSRVESARELEIFLGRRKTKNLVRHKVLFFLGSFFDANPPSASWRQMIFRLLIGHHTSSYICPDGRSRVDRLRMQVIALDTSCRNKTKQKIGDCKHPESLLLPPYIRPNKLF